MKYNVFTGNNKKVGIFCLKQEIQIEQCNEEDRCIDKHFFVSCIGMSISKKNAPPNKLKHCAYRTFKSFPKNFALK